MKKFLVLAITIGLAVGAMAANHLSFSDISIEAGSTATVSVNLENQDKVAGFQFDMKLPDGLDVVTDSRGRMVFTLNPDRIDSHSVSSNRKSNGNISVIAFSITADPFYDNDGEILTFQVKASDTYCGRSVIEITDIHISNPDGIQVQDSSNATIHVNGSEQEQATGIAIDRLYAVMNVNESATFTATVSPEGAAQSVKWTSSDEGIATVDATGKVTGVSKGVAVITATTTDGSNLKAQAVAIVEKTQTKGDVNMDGIVDINDISEIINIILK